MSRDTCYSILLKQMAISGQVNEAVSSLALQAGRVEKIYNTASTKVHGLTETFKEHYSKKINFQNPASQQNGQMESA